MMGLLQNNQEGTSSKGLMLGRGALPLRNIPQGVLLLYPLPLVSKRGTVPHQSTKSCGPGIILLADKCSDNITATDNFEKHMAIRIN